MKKQKRKYIPKTTIILYLFWKLSSPLFLLPNDICVTLTQSLPLFRWHFFLHGFLICGGIPDFGVIPLISKLLFQLVSVNCFFAALTEVFYPSRLVTSFVFHLVSIQFSAVKVSTVQISASKI